MDAADLKRLMLKQEVNCGVKVLIFDENGIPELRDLTFGEYRPEIDRLVLVTSHGKGKSCLGCED